LPTNVFVDCHENAKGRSYAMKIRLVFTILGMLGLLFVTGTAQARPQYAPIPTSFTYQGSLVDGGGPANGAYDFQFSLYNDVSAGDQMGSTVQQDNVIVTNGLFTVQLDFGDVFDGTALYLEIAVRAGSSVGPFTTLTPRQPLTATPYALHAFAVPWSGITGMPAGFADGVDDTVSLAGSGSATTAARSDHNHFGQTWTGGGFGTGLWVSGGGTALRGDGASFGVQGNGDGAGVFGAASATGGKGIWGQSFGGGDYAGYFNGNVYTSGNSTVLGNVEVSGNLSVGGAKAAVVDTKDYGRRTLYAVESPQSWFEDFGTGQLANGAAAITIEPIFAETVNLTEDYHVFLTPLGDCALYVSGKSPTSFNVRAMGGSTCSTSFDYRIVAKRLGFENLRLAEVNDPPPATVESH
jgi:hypothetical protein